MPPSCDGFCAVEFETVVKFQNAEGIVLLIETRQTLDLSELIKLKAIVNFALSKAKRRENRYGLEPAAG